VARFHAFLAQEVAIRDALKLTGDYDYLLKVTVGDLAALSALIRDLAGLRDCVGHLRTAVVLERLKEAGCVFSE